MSLLTIANLLLIFSIVAYFLHSYFRDTVDFSQYRGFIAVPVANRAMKYVYVHSFFLFVVAAAGFLASVVLSSFNISSSSAARAILGLSIVLALVALRLVTMPAIGRWPRRAE